MNTRTTDVYQGRARPADASRTGASKAKLEHESGGKPGLWRHRGLAALLCLMAVSGASPDDATGAQPAERCVNVSVAGSATLGFVSGCGSPGFGGIPFPVDLGGISGMMSSVVITQEGQPEGAQHLTLRHCFTSSIGRFTTEDRAVCSPAGRDPAVCRVNDVLTIVSGDGVFANPSGSLRNHGVIDFAALSLTFDIRGRVCGDGI